MSLRLHLIPVLIIAAAIGAGRESSAQGISRPRPVEGLFGGIRPDVNAPKRLDFNVSLLEGYDEDIPTEAQSRIDRSTPQSGGLSTMVNASAAYGSHTDRTDVGANASSMVRYYSDIGGARSVAHSAGLGVSTRLPGHLTLFANQAASYSPIYLYGLFPRTVDIDPGYAASTLPDYAVTDFYATSYLSSVTLRHDLGRRSSVSAGGDYTYTDRHNETENWQDASLYRVRGGYSIGTTRNTRLTVQGSYRSGGLGYVADRTTSEVGADVLWDYTRPLSGTRSLTVTLGLGVSGADVPQTIQGVNVVRRQYKSVGSVRFGYPFGRTWHLQGNFRRGLEYVMDLPTPVFGNGFILSLSGLLHRRLDLEATGGYSSGASVLSQQRQQYDTYAADVRLRFAINEMFATHVGYLYYYYDFFGPIELASGLPLGLQRNAVRAGLTMWVPAFRR